MCICIYSCACYLSVASQRASCYAHQEKKEKKSLLNSRWVGSGEWRVAVTENDGGIWVVLICWPNTLSHIYTYIHVRIPISEKRGPECHMRLEPSHLHWEVVCLSRTFRARKNIYRLCVYRFLPAVLKASRALVVLRMAHVINDRFRRPYQKLPALATCIRNRLSLLDSHPSLSPSVATFSSASSPALFFSDTHARDFRAHTAFSFLSLTLREWRDWSGEWPGAFGL